MCEGYAARIDAQVNAHHPILKATVFPADPAVVSERKGEERDQRTDIVSPNAHDSEERPPHTKTAPISASVAALSIKDERATHPHSRSPVINPDPNIAGPTNARSATPGLPGYISASRGNSFIETRPCIPRQSRLATPSSPRHDKRVNSPTLSTRILPAHMDPTAKRC